MAGLTFDQLALKIEGVKDLLDQPARKFLKSDTITTVLNRSYNLVNFQITITANPPTTGNQIMVVDAVYAISAWMCFGIFGQSISNTLQLQDISAYEANLQHYKDMAIMAAGFIGVSIDTSSETGSTPPLDDPLPVFTSGGSLIDQD